MLAVIKTGGKQYIVTPGKKIKIEKIEGKEGSEIIFSEVLLLAYGPSGQAQLGEKDDKVDVGNPLAKDAKVTGKILKQGKGEKVIIFKYKPKKRYHVKKGHRQLFTEVEITEIKA